MASSNSRSRQPKLASKPKGTTPRHQQSMGRRKSRLPSEAGPHTKENSGSPRSDVTTLTSDSHSTGSNIEFSRADLEPSFGALSDLPGAARLKNDIRFFLSYHRQNLQPRHYFLKPPASSFIKNDMIAQALGYEPLLYAVAAFAAYHYSVGHPNGKIVTFLHYYTESVTSLLKTFKAGEGHSVPKLLTILQLATCEVWILPFRNYRNDKWNVSSR